MCFSTSVETPIATPPEPVDRNANANLLAEARLRRRRARGSRANIFTSALGDSEFGSFVNNDRNGNDAARSMGQGL
jgi:hypothetical protein